MSTNRVLILHGWGGSDYPHWQANYASKIAKDYGCVYFPLLDNPHFPDKNRWLKRLEDIMSWYQPNSVITHSLGTILWFWYANKEDAIKVDNLILVAPPSIHCTIDTVSTFFPYPIPENLHAKKSWLIGSDNDQYLLVDELKELSAKLDIDPIILKDAGHINGESGYGEFEALDTILKEIL